MGWIDARLGTLESRFEQLRRDVSDLITQLKGAAQTARNAFQQNSGNPNAVAGTFMAYPTSIIAVGGSLSIAVYQVAGGLQTLVGTYTIYNYGNSPTVAGSGSTFPVYLIPDGQGGFTIINQTCA